MILVDANLLIYAIDRESVHHSKARGVAVFTADRDFRKFPGVSVINPLAS